MNTPTITYHSLSDYIGGTCISKTFDVGRLTTHAFHLEEIKEWLNGITEDKKDGELREEWIVCDYDNIPVRFVGEYNLDSEWFDYVEAREESHLDDAAFEAGMELGLPLDYISETYAGHFDSDTDLAYEYVETSGMLDGVPESICMYFNYESFGRDLAINDYSEFNGHYFHCH